MWRVARAGLGAVLAVAAAATAAHAGPEAEKLFRDGRDRMKKGEVAEACDLFARSQRLEPKVGRR